MYIYTWMYVRVRKTQMKARSQENMEVGIYMSGGVGVEEVYRLSRYK